MSASTTTSSNVTIASVATATVPVATEKFVTQSVLTFEIFKDLHSVEIGDVTIPVKLMESKQGSDTVVASFRPSRTGMNKFPMTMRNQNAKSCTMIFHNSKDEVFPDFKPTIN